LTATPPARSFSKTSCLLTLAFFLLALFGLFSLTLSVFSSLFFVALAALLSSSFALALSLSFFSYSAIALICLILSSCSSLFFCTSSSVMFIIFYIIYILLLGAAAGALAVGLATIPAYIFHTYYFVRSCYWWCKTSRVKD
jgi:hypothetical protein